MSEAAGETISCQYCGADIQVSAGRSRYEASVTHFEAEHVERSESFRGGSEQSKVGAREVPPTEGEEQGIGD